jgi:hypothetical protein
MLSLFQFFVMSKKHNGKKGLWDFGTIFDMLGGNQTTTTQNPKQQWHTN